MHLIKIFNNILLLYNRNVIHYKHWFEYTYMTTPQKSVGWIEI